MLLIFGYQQAIWKYLNNCSLETRNFFKRKVLQKSTCKYRMWMHQVLFRPSRSGSDLPPPRFQRQIQILLQIYWIGQSELQQRYLVWNWGVGWGGRRLGSGKSSPSRVDLMWIRWSWFEQTCWFWPGNFFTDPAWSVSMYGWLLCPIWTKCTGRGPNRLGLHPI